MTYKSTSSVVQGKVLNYDPVTNSIHPMDYVERSVHLKHKKMFKITTKQGYTITVTDDHSLATNGNTSFFKPLKPHKSLHKFVPIIFMVDLPPDEGEYNSLVSMPISRLKEKIDSIFKEEKGLFSYDALSEENKHETLLGLARLGYGPVSIEGLHLFFRKPFKRLIPEKGELLEENEVANRNPANNYLHMPFTWDEVIKVEKVPREDITYDFTVPKFPLFIANGILVYDTMMVHTPTSESARVEAIEKMLPSKNLFQPRTLQPLLLPQQEHVLGLYLASQDAAKYVKDKVKAKTYNDADQLLQDIKMGNIKPNDPVSFQGNITTAGMAVINAQLPLYARKYDALWDKKYMTRVLSMVAKQNPEKYAYIAQVIKELGALYAYKTKATFKQSDFDLQKLKKMRDHYFKLVQNNINKIDKDKSLSKKEKEIEVGKELRKAQAFSSDLTNQQAGNMFHTLMVSGAKGSPGQVMQVLSSPTVVADPKDRLIPQLIQHSYLEGMTPAEFFTSSYGTRKGSVGAKLSVAPAGGLSKELAANVLDIVITCKDCHTPNGIKLNIDDSEDIIYRVEAGTNKFIDPNYYEQLKKQGKTEVTVRSPSTCEAREGICQFCYGYNAKMKFPEIGENVGINSTHAITEPLTQMGLSSKHTAGSAAGETVGFNTIKSFFNMSSKFSGSAVVSEVSGNITKVEPSITGGINIYVGKKKYYAPPGRSPKVKIGDSIKAGDPLTDGILNFSKVVPYKGIEEGRQEFINSAYNLFDKAGQHSIKKNFEVVSRGLINYVEIQDPKDWDEFVEGDIVDYNKLQADIRSHPGKEPPVFTPYQKGTNKSPMFKQDWLTNFGFKFLKDQMINNAATFSRSKKHQYNPIGPYARGAEFGKGKNGKY